MATQALSPVEAETTLGVDAARVKGARVHAETNSVEKML
jgi:hypothetical protein